MSFNIIRTATAEDTARLEAARARFVARYGFEPGYVRPGEDVYVNGVWVDSRYALRNWRRAVRRALQHPWAESIAYGYIGYSSN